MTIRDQIIQAKKAELLTPKEYAALTRTHLDVVYRRCREGRQAGAQKHGGIWLIDLAMIPQGYITKRCRPSGK